ncbi:MAG TPA: ribonuclease HI family protein [Marmoricola sp.]
MTIVAAADGSALGNPGPAGWAWYVDDARWASGGWPHGTNNMGELTAVLRLLEATAEVDDELLIYCDSTYAINTVTKWMANWKRRGWRKGDGKPVLNLEIVQALDAAMVGRNVRFEWVKGHAGHPLNEEADRLANAAALAYREGREPDEGPGYGGPAPIRRAVAALDPEPEEDFLDLFSDLDAELDPVDLPPSDLDRIVALERSLLTDEVRADRASVAGLLHPQWREIGRSGRLWTRDEMLESIAPIPGGCDLEVVSVAEVAPGVVLLVWRGSDDRGATLRSSWWRRDGGDRGAWRQYFHQGTAEGGPA